MYDTAVTKLAIALMSCQATAAFPDTTRPSPDTTAALHDTMAALSNTNEVYRHERGLHHGRIAISTWCNFGSMHDLATGYEMRDRSTDASRPNRDRDVAGPVQGRGIRAESTGVRSTAVSDI